MFFHNRISRPPPPNATDAPVRTWVQHWRTRSGPPASSDAANGMGILFLVHASCVRRGNGPDAWLARQFPPFGVHESSTGNAEICSLTSTCDRHPEGPGAWAGVIDLPGATPIATRGTPVAWHLTPIGPRTAAGGRSFAVGVTTGSRSFADRARRSQFCSIPGRTQVCSSTLVPQELGRAPPSFDGGGAVPAVGVAR